MNKIDNNETNIDRRISKRYILISSLTLTVSLVMLIFASVAWFTSDIFNPSQNGAVIGTSGIDNLEVEMYSGIDLDNDGEIDGFNENNLRTENLTHYTKMNYESLGSSDFFTESGCLSGKKVNFKIVIENTNDFGIKIGVSYANLNSYFNEILQNITLDGAEISTYNGSENLSLLDSKLCDYSARIMFQINSIKATEYTDEDESGDFNTVAAQKVISDTASNLWEISAGQEFVSGITIGSGNLLEINFVLECLQLTDIVNGYTLYCEQYADTIENLEDKAKFEALYKYEIDYVNKAQVNDSGNLDNGLKFTLEYVSVRGEQMPHENT